MIYCYRFHIGQNLICGVWPDCKSTSYHDANRFVLRQVAKASGYLNFVRLDVGWFFHQGFIVHHNIITSIFNQIFSLSETPFFPPVCNHPLAYEVFMGTDNEDMSHDAHPLYSPATTSVFTCASSSLPPPIAYL